MAHIIVRLNTQAMAFPLLSEQSGRTVIDGRGDLTYVPGVSTDGDVPQDRGIPGIFYVHNVVPSVYGWQSVEYLPIIQELIGNNGQVFNDNSLIQGSTVTDPSPPVSSNKRSYLATVLYAGATYLYYLNSSELWQPVTSGGIPIAVTGNVRVSVANVNGISYIFLPGAPYVYTINAETGVLYSRTLLGLNIASILGMISSNGYLIVWTTNRISWSSTINVEDFVPSDVTGAGSGGIQEAEGKIVHCRATNSGFIIFTDVNCVSAVYTSNAKFPFQFKSISSAGGVYSPSLVSREDSLGYLYAYTTHGIQRISHIGATNVLSSISDFISGRVFEDFVESSGTFTRELLSSDMGRSVEVIANRYIVISYARSVTGIYTHAIIVDTMQKRIGKLKIDHTTCFSYKELVSQVLQDSRAQIAFLQPTGYVKKLEFTSDSITANGVMLMGKLQYMHSRLLHIHEVEIENGPVGENFSVGSYISHDGKNLGELVTGYPNAENTGSVLKKYFFDAVGKSHSLLIKGAFDLVSILVHLSVHGKR